MTFTKREFQEWLEKQPKRRFRRKRDESCPLAEFLCSKTGSIYTSVGDKTIYLEDGRSIQTPVWARGFISRVDGSRRKTISAQEALELL